MVVDLDSCARCGESHSIAIVTFSGQPLECDGKVYTHYGICTLTGDPVLVRIIEEVGPEGAME